MDIGIILTSDEEIGGFHEVGHLIDQGYTADVVVLPDGGDNWRVILAAKGILLLKLSAKGKAVHGSRVWLGDNAGDKLINIYTKLKRQFDCSDVKNHWHNTLNLGKMVGGEATNKVMDEAALYLDIRYTPDHTKDQILTWVKQAASGYNQVQCEEIVSGPPFFMDRDNRFIRVWFESMLAEGVSHWWYGKDHGASDGRFFMSKGIPMVISKPISGGLHTNQEWLEVNSLHQFIRVLNRWVLRLHNLDSI